MKVRALRCGAQAIQGKKDIVRSKSFLSLDFLSLSLPLFTLLTC